MVKKEILIISVLVLLMFVISGCEKSLVGEAKGILKQKPPAEPLVDGRALSFSDVWNNYYDTNYPSSGLKIIKGSDNGYVIIGRKSVDTNNYTTHSLILKVNEGGNILWGNIIEGGDFSGGKDILVPEAHDDKYIFVGYNSLSPGEMGEASLASIDLDGNILWQTTVQDNEDINRDEVFGLAECANLADCYIGIGTAFQEGVGYLPWFIKFDGDNGGITHNYVHTDHNLGFSIPRTSEYGTISAEYTSASWGRGFLFFDSDYFLKIFDGEFNYIDTLSNLIPSGYEVKDLLRLSPHNDISDPDEGEYLLTSVADNFDNRNSILVQKINIYTRVISWSSYLTADFDARSLPLDIVKYSSNGHYVLVSGRNIFMIDGSNGNLIKKQNFQSGESVNSIVEGNDPSTFVITGSKDLGDNNNFLDKVLWIKKIIWLEGKGEVIIMCDGSDSCGWCAWEELSVGPGFCGDCNFWDCVSGCSGYPSCDPLTEFDYRTGTDACNSIGQSCSHIEFLVYPGQSWDDWGICNNPPAGYGWGTWGDIYWGAQGTYGCNVFAHCEMDSAYYWGLGLLGVRAICDDNPNANPDITNPPARYKPSTPFTTVDYTNKVPPDGFCVWNGNNPANLSDTSIYENLGLCDLTDYWNCLGMFYPGYPDVSICTWILTNPYLV